ncbi:MAG: hypothetical protein GC208_01625 [Alphaproteobacteria bacterium]|nr:hypothetical protein [Alphaproteobacteria bacterium]
MTSIIVWQPRETIFKGSVSLSQQLNIVADSRISSTSQIQGTSTRILSDRAAKLLRLPFEIFRDEEYGPGCGRVFQGDIGFCFAGSTLSASLTYSLCASAFQSLRINYDEEFPEFEEFIRFICTAATSYIKEVQSPFEAFLTGSELSKKGSSAPNCYKIEFNPITSIVEYTKINLDPNGSFGVIGSNKVSISKELSDGFEGNIEFDPREIVLEKVKENSGPIGGAIQRAQARLHGFILLPNHTLDTSTDFKQFVGMGPKGSLSRVGNLRVEPYIQGY